MTTEKSQTQIHIEDDIKNAMRANDKQTRETLRVAVSKIQIKAKDDRKDFASEEDVIGVIQTFKKQVQEEMDGFEKALQNEKNAELKMNKEARIAALKTDIVLLEKYLPAQMSKVEIQAAVQGVVEKLGESANIGSVMKEIMPIVKGKADNKIVNEVVREALK